MTSNWASRKESASMDSFLKTISSRFSPLRVRPGDHLGRRIDSLDAAGRPDALFRGDSKCSCSATHIQDRLARLEPRKIEHPLPERTLAPAHQKPSQNVVKARGMKDDTAASRARMPLLNRVDHGLLLAFTNRSLELDICSLSSVG